MSFRHNRSGHPGQSRNTRNSRHPINDSDDNNQGHNSRYQGNRYQSYRPENNMGRNRNARQTAGTRPDNAQGANGYPHNSNYKGRNYDPNYHANRSANFSHQSSRNPAPQQSRQRFGGGGTDYGQPCPSTPSFHDQRHQQKPAHPSSQMPHGNKRRPHNSRVERQRQVWEQLREEILKMQIQDSEGDVHMCSCPDNGTGECQGLRAQYQKRLELFARLQHDVARFILFLASKYPTSPDIIREWADEFISENNVATFELIVKRVLNANSAAQLGAMGLGIDILADDSWDSNDGIN